MTTHDANRDKTQQALQLLCQARDLLTQANAPKTAARVRLAISSARGAVRNADYRQSRAMSQASR